MLKQTITPDHAPNDASVILSRLSGAAISTPEKLELLCELRRQDLDIQQYVQLTMLLEKQSIPGQEVLFTREWMPFALGRSSFRDVLKHALEVESSAEDPVLFICAAKAAIQLSLTQQARQYAASAFRHSGKLWPRQLNQLLLIAEQCGSQQLIADLVDKLTREHPSELSPERHRRIETAQHNRRPESVCNRVRLVSLGRQCLPWGVPNQWGMRTNLTSPNLRMPFNKAFWTGAGVINALEDRLDHLSDPACYRLVNSPRGMKVPFHTRYFVSLNHDTIIPGREHELEDILTECAFRRENFLKVGCSSPRVYVFWNDQSTDLDRLEASLAALAQDDQYILLVLDACRDPDWQKREFTDRPHRRVRKINIPNDNFRWHQENTSPVGICFERVVHDIIIEVMSELVGTTSTNSLPDSP